MKQNDEFRRRDLLPFPLAIDVHYAADEWDVQLVVVDEMTAGGYSSIPVAEFHRPYDLGQDGAPDMSRRAATEVIQAALATFAQPLQRALTMPGDR